MSNGNDLKRTRPIYISQMYDYVFNEEEEMKRKRKTRKEDEKRKKHFHFYDHQVRTGRGF